MHFPVWIQKSNLYQELCSTFGAENISVPKQYTNFDLQIKDENDIEQFMNLLQFWCVKESDIPVFFFDFICNTSLPKFSAKTLDLFYRFDPSLKLYLQIFQLEDYNEHSLLYYAIQCENLELIKYFISTRQLLIIFNSEYYKFAIQSKAFQSFLFLYETVLRPQPHNVSTDVFVFAAKCGFEPVLEYGLNKYYDLCKTKSHDFLVTTGTHGHFNCVQVLLKHNFVATKDCLHHVAASGHVNCFQLLLENCKVSNPVDVFTFCAHRAAVHNKVKMLQFIYENCSKTIWSHIGQTICDIASVCCFPDILVYAFENGCPVSADTTALAAKENFLFGLKYLHEHGCPWDKRCLLYAAERDAEDCFLYALHNGCPKPKYCVYG